MVESSQRTAHKLVPDRDWITVGSGKGDDIVVSDPKVKPRKLLIEADVDVVQVTYLDSKLGPTLAIGRGQGIGIRADTALFWSFYSEGRPEPRSILLMNLTGGISSL